MKAEDFDSKFDEGKQDIIDDLDLSTARRMPKFSLLTQETVHYSAATPLYHLHHDQYA